jgi:hypothetical protein
VASLTRFREICANCPAGRLRGEKMNRIGHLCALNERRSSWIYN